MHAAAVLLPTRKHNCDQIVVAASTGTGEMLARAYY